jgi:hypothetical protein
VSAALTKIARDVERINASLEFPASGGRLLPAFHVLPPQVCWTVLIYRVIIDKNIADWPNHSGRRS